MAKFKVLDVRKIASGDNSRVGKLDYLITYEIDPLRASMVTVSKDTLTEADIIEAVKADLEPIQRFTGKEIQF